LATHGARKPVARVVNPSVRSKTTMNEREKSDRPVVPEKSANEKQDYWSFFKERMEGRGLAKEKEEGEALLHAEPATQVDRTPSRVGKGGGEESAAADPEDLSQGLDRIRAAARKDKELKFTSLWHHVYDVARLREAYFALRRDAAAGVDGQTWQEYGSKLEGNLGDLSDRLARGAYRAKPVRRVYIPKPDGRERPIGIPALEDKLVQRAMVQVLNAVWETDFLGFSYGFRPGRSAHMALDALSVGIQTRKVNWILDADIKSFFDTLSHERLIEFVGHRIADRRVVRHIQKWLNAGVMEDGRHVEQEEGTPQGGSISPLLANLYLHYVLDLWADQWRRTRARGDVIIVRYADDSVVGFEHESDALRFLEELKERFRKFNLELHADKTRVIEFGRFARENRRRKGQGKPENFNFLGFTHVCDLTRTGKFIVLRRTMAKRMRIKLASIKQELRRRMHDPVCEVGKWLAAVLRGHYRYFGVPRNYRALASFFAAIRRLWHRSLNRRCQSRHKGMTTVARLNRLVARWLPSPRICQPYPSERLYVIIQGKSPVR
jgi:RNA-directed DNA polymerase